MRRLPLARLFPGLLVALLAAGCGDRDCSTPTCIADAAVHDWPADTRGVTARVAALPDEVVRTVVVGRLCDAYPGQTAALCAALPAGLSRDRCERLNGRPHLSFDPSRAAASPARGAGDVPPDMAGGPPGAGTPPGPPGAANPGTNLARGPASDPRVVGNPGTKAPAEGQRSTFPEVYLPVEPATLEAGLCATAPDRSACLDDAAQQAGIAGDAGRAEAVCSLHSTVKWADECRFNAAEQTVRSAHAKGYATAAALCGRSTEFSQECWSHILTWLPRRVPPPEGSVGLANGAASLAHEIEAAWAPVSAAAAERHRDRFWAIYFTNMYRQSSDPNGVPFTMYPAESLPHARAAAAMRLRDLGRLRGDLASQAAALDGALARVTPGAAQRGHLPDLVFVQNLGHLPDDVPSVFFLGAARRPVSADPAIDTLLCVLESGAHASHPDTAVLQEAANHPNPVVATEAKRLLAALAAGD